MNKLHEAASEALRPLFDSGALAATKYVSLTDGGVIMWLYPKAPAREIELQDTMALLDAAKARGAAPPD